jgi:hypothetical protein
MPALAVKCQTFGEHSVHVPMWLQRYVWYLIGPYILQSQGAVPLIFFEHAGVWYVWPSMDVFTCRFKTLGLDPVAVAKGENGCPKIILDAGLVADSNFRFPGLHGHLTWILPICGRIVNTSGELCHRIQQFASERQNRRWIFEPFRVSFSCWAGLCSSKWIPFQVPLLRMYN